MEKNVRGRIKLKPDQAKAVEVRIKSIRKAQEELQKYLTSINLAPVGGWKDLSGYKLVKGIDVNFTPGAECWECGQECCECSVVCWDSPCDCTECAGDVVSFGNILVTGRPPDARVSFEVGKTGRLRINVSPDVTSAAKTAGVKKELPK